MGIYDKLGVSASKEELHKAIKSISKGVFKNSFCKAVPDYLGGDKDSCIFMHSDGAGTKSILAYLYWKETGDLSVWDNIVQDSIVMNTNDLLCVGVLGNSLISSTIGRNKSIIPSEVISRVINGTERFLAKLRDMGFNINSTGGETADIGDIVKTIILDSTVVSRIKKDKVIENNIKVGDIIIGLSSYGKANYENQYNSGIASNGLTLARHHILSKYIMDKYPESFSSSIDKRFVYKGSYKLTDDIPISYDKDSSIENIGKALLSPTRTFFPIFNEILPKYFNKISAIIHCTGGGQTKALKFVNNIHIIKEDLFPMPAIFRMVLDSGVSIKEMYNVFNMGHLMEIYIGEKFAEDIINISKSFGVDAKIIGYCKDSDKNKLTIKSDLGEFSYF